MDGAHARKHLDDLHATLQWLRTLTPDNPRYKVWLGDLVEFTRAAFGLDSAEMAAIRAAIPDPLPAASIASPGHAYLARLDRFAAVLQQLATATHRLDSATPPSLS